jgi:predicted O-methyltransferase YrrM
MVNLPDGYFGPEQINLYRSLIELLPDNATIVELGVWQGRSLCSIADIVKRKNISVYAVDTFEGTPGEPGDELINIAKNKNILTTFQDNLKQFDLESNVTILKGRTDEMHEYVGAKSLDLVFIDAGHDYQSVSTDISLWLPKVKDNGILVGHDYSATFPDVEKAVKERFGSDFAVNTEMWIHYKPQANRLTSKAATAPVRPPIKHGRPTVAAEISTKDRYNTTLPLAIYAIASQTVKVDKLIIFDDGEQIDLRAVPLYAHLFALLQRKGIPWFVNFGNKT